MKVEIYTKNGKRFPCLTFPGFENQYKNKWVATMNKREAKNCVKRAEARGLYAIAFDEKYDRSSTYRSDFIRANPSESGIYRCAYCGRKIPVRKMVVDHVTPVALAKRSKRIQNKFMEKEGINSVRNLVPSCRKCNEKKGTSYALKWRIKAFWGKRRWFWIIRKAVFILLLLLVLHVIGMYLGSDLPPKEFALAFFRYVKGVFAVIRSIVISGLSGFF